MLFGLLIRLHPGDQFERAVHRLDDRRAAFHPVAGVDVADTVDILHHRMMNMSADDAVHIVAARFVRHHALELADEIDGMLDLELRPG